MIFRLIASRGGRGAFSRPIPDHFYWMVSGLGGVEESDVQQSTSDSLDFAASIRSQQLKYTVPAAAARPTRKKIVVTAWILKLNPDQYPDIIDLLVRAIRDGFDVFVPQHNGSLSKPTTESELRTAFQGMSGQYKAAAIGAKDMVVRFDQSEIFKFQNSSKHLIATSNRLHVTRKMGLVEALSVVENFPSIKELDLSEINLDSLHRKGGFSRFEELLDRLSTNAPTGIWLNFGHTNVDMEAVAKVASKFKVRGIRIRFSSWDQLKRSKIDRISIPLEIDIRGLPYHSDVGVYGFFRSAIGMILSDLSDSAYALSESFRSFKMSWIAAYSRSNVFADLDWGQTSCYKGFPTHYVCPRQSSESSGRTTPATDGSDTDESVESNVVGSIVSSKSRVDTNTETISNIIKVDRYYGSPMFEAAFIRESVYSLNDLEIKPHFTEVSIPKSDSEIRDPDQRLHYKGIFEVKIGQRQQIGTPSSSFEIEGWWCRDPNIIPTFYHDSELGLFEIMIPKSMSDLSSTTISVAVKNNSDIFDLPAPEHWLILPTSESDLSRAFKIINIKDTLSANVPSGRNVYHQIESFFRKFELGKTLNWEEVTGKFPALSGLTLTNSEQKILQVVISKKGCCRHVAWAASAILSVAYGFECRVAQNDIHAFAEINTTSGWFPLNLWFNGSRTNVTYIDSKSVAQEQAMKEEYLKALRRYLTPQTVDVKGQNFNQYLRHKTLYLISPGRMEKIRFLLLDRIKAESQQDVLYIETEKTLQQVVAQYPRLVDVCVVINWSGFSQNERVACQSVLDPQPTFNGRSVTIGRLISLYEDDAESQLLHDFKDRHSQVLRLDFGYGALSPQEINPIPDEYIASDLKKGYVNWNSKLAGYLDIGSSGNGVEFVPGILSTIAEANRPCRIILKNPPKSRDFEVFCEEVVRNRRFLEAGADGHVKRSLPYIEFSSVNADVEMRPIQKIDSRTIENFRAEGRAVWVITRENFHLFLPHHACELTESAPDDQLLDLETRIKSHPGYFADLADGDLVCVCPEISADLRGLILDELPGDKNLNVGVLEPLFFEPQRLRATQSHESIRYYFGSSIGVSNALFSYRLDDGQFKVTYFELWNELQRGKDIVLYGLTKRHPLYKEFVIAQKTGVLLTSDRKILVNSRLTLVESPEKIQVKELSVRSTDDHLLPTLRTAIIQNRVVTFIGKAGTGKSEAIYQLDQVITPFYGLGAVGNWLDSTEKIPTLVIDEFNLLPQGSLDFLIGIVDRNPRIIHQGTLRIVGEPHRIVLLGNFSDQVGRIKTEIEQYSCTVKFAEVPADKMVDGSLPYVEIDEERAGQFKDVVVPLIGLVREHLPEYPISFRDIQMILNTSLALNAPAKTFSWRIAMACDQELSYFFERAGKMPIFSQWLLKYGYKSHCIDPHTIISDRVNFQCEQRRVNWDQESDDRPFAKCGVLFEGPSGVGKSTVLRDTLKRLEFAEDHPNPRLRYTCVSLSSGNLGALRHRLKEAAETGTVVILDEMNTNPGLIEDILTEIMSSGGANTTLKVHPGFRIFVTQNNAGEMTGRQMLPNSILSRFQCVMVPGVTKTSLSAILNHGRETQSRISDLECRAWLRVLNEDHHLTPRLIKRYLDHLHSPQTS